MKQRLKVTFKVRNEESFSFWSLFVKVGLSFRTEKSKDNDDDHALFFLEEDSETIFDLIYKIGWNRFSIVESSFEIIRDAETPTM